MLRRQSTDRAMGDRRKDATGLTPTMVPLVWQATAAVAAALLGAAALYLLLAWLLDLPQRPSGTQLEQQKLLADVAKIALGLAAGVGAAVAVIIGYRRARVEETASHRDDQRLFSSRYQDAADLLGHDKAAVRLAGIYALSRLADDWTQQRQQCLDVLCAHLRLPYDPQKCEPGEGEVRLTLIRLITAHLRPEATTSWCGHDLDFTGAVFDGGNFSRAVFSGGTVSFVGAKFVGGSVDFSSAEFSGATVQYKGAEFSGSTVDFLQAKFSGGDVSFGSAKFSGGKVNFAGAKFSGGTLTLSEATFSGSVVGFEFARFSGGTIHFSGIGHSGHLASLLGLRGSQFSGGIVRFDGARFSGAHVHYSGAKFSGATVRFVATEFSGGSVGFGDAEFSGGTVDFRSATFSGGTVDFRGATFSGGTAPFAGATFSGGTVDFAASVFSGTDIDLSGARVVAAATPPLLPLNPGAGLKAPSTWAT